MQGWQADISLFFHLVFLVIILFYGFAGANSM